MNGDINKMEILNKQKQNKLRKLLNSCIVGEFQKTLIKTILKNCDNKNLSRADIMLFDDLIRRYN